MDFFLAWALSILSVLTGFFLHSLLRGIPQKKEDRPVTRIIKKAGRMFTKRRLGAFEHPSAEDLRLSGTPQAEENQEMEKTFDRLLAKYTPFGKKSHGNGQKTRYEQPWI